MNALVEKFLQETCKPDGNYLDDFHREEHWGRGVPQEWEGSSGRRISTPHQVPSVGKWLIW